MSTITISVDTDVQATYVRFSDQPVARTIEHAPSILIDVAADGTAIGVELLGPDGSLPTDALARDFGIDPDVLHQLASAIPHIA